MINGSAEELVQEILTRKPYLIALEEEVQKLEYGEMDVKITIRAKVVEKMQFIKAKTWLKKDWFA